MDDLDRFIEELKQTDSAFAKNFDEGYKLFKVGVMLKQARIESGRTQEEIAKKLGVKKSAISRIENHAEEVRLSTLHKYTDALGKSLHVVIQ